MIDTFDFSSSRYPSSQRSSIRIFFNTGHILYYSIFECLAKRTNNPVNIHYPTQERNTIISANNSCDNVLTKGKKYRFLFKVPRYFFAFVISHPRGWSRNKWAERTQGYLNDNNDLVTDNSRARLSLTYMQHLVEPRINCRFFELVFVPYLRVSRNKRDEKKGRT